MKVPPFKASLSAVTALLLAAPPLLANAEPSYQYMARKPGLLVTPSDADNGQGPGNGAPEEPLTKAEISALAGFSFGSVSTAGSKSLTFTVANTGTTTLEQVYVEAGATSVSTTTSTCGTESAPLQSLAKNATCSITLKWTPTAEGPFSTTLKVFTSGVLLAQDELTGTGAPPATVKLQPAGFRTWSDGTLASSCKNYLTPLDTSYVYQGNTGSGIYKILPAGQSATLVYCDMVTAGGGWTLIGKYAQWEGPMLELRSVMLRGASMQGWSNTPGTHPAYKGNNVFQEIRYATGNANWNSKYGVTGANGIKFATWATWPNITSANQWVVNAKKLDGTSNAALATVASHAAAWWKTKPVEQTRQGRGLEFSLFTTATNSGDCGGESTVATNKICGITGFWSGGSAHYDIISEKWLYGR